MNGRKMSESAIGSWKYQRDDPSVIVAAVIRGCYSKDVEEEKSACNPRWPAVSDQL